MQAAVRRPEGPAESGAIAPEVRVALLRSVVRIRLFEQRAAELFAAGKIPGFIHTYLGEEAVAAGACAALRTDDYITSTHRGHGHCLAKGADSKKMMAELFGRATGYCKGKGGSMHIAAAELGILGANGIVAGGLPIAVGAAYSARVRGSDAVALAFFGDGAVNQGAFHEALNLAAVQALPVVFVCENNGYAEMTPLAVHTRLHSLADRAQGYDMLGLTVDGNDAEQVYAAVREAAGRARGGDGPTFVEARTYRWHGHFEGDGASYRPEGELARWKSREPLALLRDRLQAEGLIDGEAFGALEAELRAEIERAVEFADASPWPGPESTLEDVWATAS